MALILSLETSTNVCSVALTQQNTIVASKKLYEDKSHSTYLTILIQEVMSQAKVALKDVDAIAVSKGPGSYTGLRIGVSTAKGLCYSLDKPLIAINTLRAMAHEVSIASGSANLLCPMIDARRMEVYTALYDTELSELEPTSAKILDEFSYAETMIDHSVLFFGNGSGKFRELIGPGHRNARFLDDITPSASSVGILAGEEYLNNRFEDVVYFEPYYLKDFVATTPKKLL